jgi:hypothetical protein
MGHFQYQPIRSVSHLDYSHALVLLMIVFTSKDNDTTSRFSMHPKSNSFTAVYLVDLLLVLHIDFTEE